MLDYRIKSYLCEEIAFIVLKYCVMRCLKKHQSIGQFIRFGIVGCAAVAIQYGVYYIMLLLSSHNVAFTIGYIVSFAINYFLTTAFTFKAHRSVVNGIGFTVCHLINFMMQIGFLNLFIILGCSEIWAPIPVYCICVPINFLLVRWVMRQ